MKKLSIIKGDTTLYLNSDNLDYSVCKNGFEWVSQGAEPVIYFQRKILGRYISIAKKFSSAGHIEHNVFRDTIVSSFSEFTVFGKKLKISLFVKGHIIDNGKVDFSIVANHEKGMNIKSIYFPRPFNAKEYDKSNSYTIDPMRQGFILPDNHSDNIQEINKITKRTRVINTGDAYLPIWGRVCGERGYAGIIEDSHDANLKSSFGADGAFLTSSSFLGSLGKLEYKRIVHYHFYDKCDYVTIAKEFRAQEISQGNFITIDDKIKANSNVSSLIGAPIVHWRIMENNVTTSGIYKELKIGEIFHNTFGETADLFRKYQSLGLNKAYVHTDGWGKRGYDNLHPYILPPCENAGGWEGLKNLSDTCHELGYKFGLHDQYRDYYQDSEVYNQEHCIVDINGKKAYCDYWAGGAHNVLCSQLAKEYVERTYRELSEHNIKVDGTYLDVFGIMNGDECYHKDHRITRKESIAYRAECFEMLRADGIIVSSEELGCQMVKNLDMVHHAPYAVTPQGRGDQVGIPIPLANLVYHDCVFVPWHIEGTGGWGIPNSDAGFLHCMLNGQSPYFNDSMKPMSKDTDEQLVERIRKVNIAADFNAKVYNAEMVSHKFIDEKYRIQQTKFSNGVSVVVNFDNNTFKIYRCNIERVSNIMCVAKIYNVFMKKM